MLSTGGQAMAEIGNIQPIATPRPIEQPLLTQRSIETSSAAVSSHQYSPDQHMQQETMQQASPEELTSDGMDSFVEMAQRQIQFAVDAETRRTIIKIIDPQTKEVVRQIPPDEVLRISRMISRFVGNRGAVTDERI